VRTVTELVEDRQAVSEGVRRQAAAGGLRIRFSFVRFWGWGLANESESKKRI
jgi:hypothetical protein